MSSFSSKLTQPPRFTRYSRAILHTTVRRDEYKIRKSLCDYVTDELDQLNRQLFFQRVTILAKNVKEENPESARDFYSNFLSRLDYMIEICNSRAFTTDDINGLFLCIGDYTLLVIETAEDMMGYFLEELVKDIEKIWQASRVFTVEDNIGKSYFQGFSSRRTIAININEKFPTATANDEELMAVQHWKIKRKLDALYNALYEYAKDSDAVEDRRELPYDELHKQLPEVQRIDLVLNSRFYRSVDGFTSIYDYVPMPKDEESVIWPVPYNYTPLSTFQRSPYDVNLTFSNYGKEGETPAEQRLSITTRPSTQEHNDDEAPDDDAGDDKEEIAN